MRTAIVLVLVTLLAGIVVSKVVNNVVQQMRAAVAQEAAR